MTIAPLESTQPQHRRTPWFVAAALLVALVALNVFTWWIELSDSLNAIGVAATEPALEDIVRYVGFEFTGDSVGFGIAIIVGAFVLSRDRSNRFAWVLGFFSIGWMIAMVLTGLTLVSIAGELPMAWAPWLASLASGPYLAFLTGTFLLVALFPTGRFPPGPWRVILRVAFALWAIVAVVSILHPGPPYGAGTTPYGFDNPVGVEFLRSFDPGIVGIASAAIGVLLIASLVARYRRADSEVRHQIKWVVVAMALLTATSILMESIDTSWEGYPVMVSLWLLMLAIGVAITKYRLYDVDIIINKALVFVGLAVVISTIYVAIVVGIGALFSGSSVWLAITATTVVAVVFEPVRAWLQGWANRLVYGRRATPYEVLSDLTARFAETEDEAGLLDQMAQRLAAGTGAERAIVWLTVEGEFRAAAVAPTNGGLTQRYESVGSLPGVAVPIQHEGKTLGALSVEKPRADAMTPTERLLTEDLAGSVGLVARRLRLDEALSHKAEQLEESRRRLVDAQDDERRRLERTLRTGPEQQVAALEVALEHARLVAAQEGTERGAMFIDQMVDDARGAMTQIRALAQGIYPPVLEAEGLSAAIPALAAQSPLEVHVTVEVGSRQPLEVEEAVYFCVSEALTNASKHGEAPVHVAVAEAGDGLSFSVTDAGPGFDLGGVVRGAGLDNIADRLDALGGSLTIRSEPGSGTTVAGSLPVFVVAV